MFVQIDKISKEHPMTQVYNRATIGTLAFNDQRETDDFTTWICSEQIGLDNLILGSFPLNHQRSDFLLKQQHIHHVDVVFLGYLLKQGHVSLKSQF